LNSADRRWLLRSAGAVSGAVALSRITGLAREMAMARLFGASAAYDAFLG
jgi:putative peptidoglycan lipid II flippase